MHSLDHFLIRTYAVFVAEFKKDVTNSAGVVEELRQILYVHGGIQLIDIDTVMREWYDEFVCDRVKKRIEEFEINGSGWSLNAILELSVFNNNYEPLRGSSYLPLPKFIDSRKAVVNVQNYKDQMFFKWSILAALHPSESHPERISHYQRFRNQLKFDSITFPVSLQQIARFERLNKNISVNVYMLDEKSKNMIIPVRLTKINNVDRSEQQGAQGAEEHHHINLLLIHEAADDDENNDDNVIDLTDDVHSHYVLIKNLSRLVRSQVAKARKKTVLNCFAKKLRSLALSIREIYKDEQAMQISDAQEKEYRIAKKCHICEREFCDMDDLANNWKVRDHCHITGLYRGPAHTKCNLIYRES